MRDERRGPEEGGSRVSREEMTKSVDVPFVSHGLFDAFPILYFSLFADYCEKVEK